MSTPELKPETPLTDAIIESAIGMRGVVNLEKELAILARKLESALNEWKRVERSLIALAEHMGWNQSEPFAGSGPIEQRIGTALVQFINLQSALNAAREAIEYALSSATPHPIQHPTMHDAWGEMRSAIAQIDKALSPQQSKTT